MGIAFKMKRIFSFALGNIWRWDRSENRDILINCIKNLDVSGIELTLATKEELYAFKLSEDNHNWLQTLSYVSIHAPFRLFEAAENDKEVIRQLDVISNLYRLLNAQNVIIHPEPELLDFDPFRQYEMKISTENLPVKSGVSLFELNKVLGKHPQMELCLDVAHAYSWSKYETGKLIDAFGDRISQVHFSGAYRKKDHQSLRKISKDFLYSIRPIESLDVPIVIEEDINVKSLTYVREEIGYIKDLFVRGFTSRSSESTRTLKRRSA